MIDDGVDEELGRLERMVPDERVQFDVGVLEADQRQAQLPLDGLELGRQFAGREDAQAHLFSGLFNGFTARQLPLFHKIGWVFLSWNSSEYQIGAKLDSFLRLSLKYHLPSMVLVSFPCSFTNPL